MKTDEATIEKEFKAGDLASIDAIERLQNLGYQPMDAEELVEQWELYVRGMKRLRKKI